MDTGLDLSALKSLKEIIGGSADDLQELVDDFIIALPRQFEQMCDAASKGEFRTLRIAAHSCKSNARDLGAVHLSALCAQLESAAAAEDTTAIPTLIEQISTVTQSVLADLSTLDVNNV